MAPAKIVVLGAGVSGLTTALLLSGNDDYNITIVAKHMPGDYDIEYASPWAGANYLPFSSEGTLERDLERNTWPELEKLARHSPEAGIHFQTTHCYRRDKDLDSTAPWGAGLCADEPWFKDVVPDCRPLRAEELQPGMDGGCSFTSVCINTALYLPWLASQCLKNGVILRRGIAEHILDAADMHHSGRKADLVVNCTGLSARRLGGVEDKTVYPVRGQIVVVRNDPQVMATISGCDDSPQEATYIMHRAAGGGTVLGGCVQPDSWESQPDHGLAIRIMKRCVELCSKLVPEGKGIEALSIIRHGVGLRPKREAGVRIESEMLTSPEGELRVVHNYGHGSYGYQTSYASSKAVVELVAKDGR